MKLKPLLSIGLLAVAAFIAPAQAAAPTQVTGEVLEVKDVAVYTYLRLKTATGETWAAVNKAPVAKGANLRAKNSRRPSRPSCLPAWPTALGPVLLQPPTPTRAWPKRPLQWPT